MDGNGVVDGGRGGSEPAGAQQRSSMRPKGHSAEKKASKVSPRRRKIQPGRGRTYLVVSLSCGLGRGTVARGWHI